MANISGGCYITMTKILAIAIMFLMFLMGTTNAQAHFAQLLPSDEIVPHTRPYGFWVGNVFEGRVLYKGKPQAEVKVEVEYSNPADEARRLTASGTPYITQSVLTDSDGVFRYAIPREGWWGFAVTFDSDETKYFRKANRKVMRGATFWVNAIEIN